MEIGYNEDITSTQLNTNIYFINEHLSWYENRTRWPLRLNALCPLRLSIRQPAIIKLPLAIIGESLSKEILLQSYISTYICVDMKCQMVTKIGLDFLELFKLKDLYRVLFR